MNEVNDANLINDAAFVVSEEVLSRNNPNFARCSPTEEELSLGLQALGLCSLSYKNTEISLDNQALQDDWMRKLGVIRNITQLREEFPFFPAASLIAESVFEIWSDTVSSLRGDKLLLESQAITGLLKGPLPGFDPTKPVPFICFRGSTSVFDFYRDLQSVKTSLLYTSKGRIAGECGLGFFEMHSELLKPQYHRKPDGTVRVSRLLETVLNNVNCADNGLLICGHSLGGAVATLFYAELLTDYPEIVDKYCDIAITANSDESTTDNNNNTGRIKIVTFGSPRAVDLRLADRLDNSPAQHLRFVNDNDVITAAPPRRLSLFYHWGKCFFAPEKFYKEDNFARTFVVMHDPGRLENSVGGRDFGVDRLSTSGIWSELVVCLKDLFAAHMLAKEKGYAGQFCQTGFEEVDTMLRAFELPEREASAIGPQASYTDILRYGLKTVIASARKYALPICILLLIVYGSVL